MTRRGRRVVRRAPKEGPSRFAPSRLGDGRALGWEGLSIEPFPTPISTAFTLAFAVGTTSVFFQQLLPFNITRGVITLERMVGQMAVWFNGADLVDPGFSAMALHVQVQLVPTSDGVFDPGAIIEPRNLTGMEDTRIIWRRSFWPSLAAEDVSTGFLPPYDTSTQVDIKSRRRYTRALYSLLLAVQLETPDASVTHIAYDLRGLFRSPDGA